ncbi:hypothetical protein RRG08_034783 [Elysia crispata]|uniref:Uncharacterized protein n=1 Tax=Elysia crispata TaxID=231223 RepID=A0AAE0YAN2_9GAST|nr:hypothetical protein RRG08_034783 [Elysia crispata]
MLAGSNATVVKERKRGVSARYVRPAQTRIVKGGENVSVDLTKNAVNVVHNPFKKDLSLLISAAVLAVAWASPCTDLCFGTCGMTADTSRILLPFFDAFVQPNQDACRAVCAASCTCVDTCTGQCATLLATCRGADSGFFHFLECQLEFTLCGGVCSTQCTLQTSANVLDRLYRTILPSGEQTTT